MAVTAAMTVSSATSTAPSGSIVATCTITNGDAGAVTVRGIRPTVAVSGGTSQATPVACGVPALGPGQTLSVAGSNGTLAKSWGVTGFGPQVGGPMPGNPASQAYAIGAVVLLTDGSVITATTTTLTVSAPSH